MTLFQLHSWKTFAGYKILGWQLCFSQKLEDILLYHPSQLNVISLLKFFSLSLVFYIFSMMWLCVSFYSSWDYLGFLNQWINVFRWFWRTLRHYLFKYCLCASFSFIFSKMPIRCTLDFSLNSHVTSLSYFPSLCLLHLE